MSKAREGKIEDSDLVKAFQAGDERSFDELVMRYQDMVFRLCVRFLGDYEEAADCAQDTFIKVYRAIHRFGFRSSFSTWLYRVTVNTCKNMLASSRFKRRRETQSLDPAQSTGANAPHREIENHRSNPEKLYEKKEKRETLHRMIQKLPKDQRMVIILRDMECLPYEDIARITGFAPGTVKSKLFRARHKITEGLKELL